MKKNILNSHKKQLVWMIIIAAIMALVIAGLPAAGILETEQTIYFPMWILLIYGAIVSFRMNYEKGNLSEHNLKMFTQVWKDSWPEKPAATSKKISLLGIGFLISLMLAWFIDGQAPNWNSSLEIPITFIAFFGSLFFGAYLLVNGIEYALRNKRAGLNSIIYLEGLRVRNTFFPWTKIERLEWSKADELNRKTGKPAAAIFTMTGTVGAQGAIGASMGHQLIIYGTAGEIVLASILDKNQFVKKLENLDKKRLLKKNES